MRRSALESIDRAIRNPWLSRISNLWFVWGLLTLGYAFVLHAADLIGPGSLALLSGFALIFLVALGGALRRSFTKRRGDQTPPLVDQGGEPSPSDFSTPEIVSGEVA